jgi:ankyrin repeat protein
LRAAKKGYEAVVKLLVKHRDVDVNSKDIKGRTPLSWTAKKGYETVV